MSAININKLLPNNMRINSAVNQLHRIGLLVTTDPQFMSRRSFINRPVVVLLILVIQMIRSITSMAIPDRYD